MKVIGITGGVGCGKTTILAYLEKNYNCRVIKTDEVGHKVLEPGHKGFEDVVLLFGDSVLDNGFIDRKKLANIVFNNKNKLLALNSIVHPLVKKYVIEEVTNCQCKNDFDFVFIESALLYEEHYELFCDETWYIYSEENIRIDRIMKERSYTLEKCKQIIANQLSEEEFKKRCDYIIDNSDDFVFTEIQIKKRLLDN